MFNRTRKLVAAVVAAACVMTGASAAFAAGSPTKGSTPKAEAVTVEYPKGTDSYQTSADGTAKVTAVNATKTKNATVHSEIVSNNVKYTVTTVATNAFKGQKHVKKIYLGRSVVKAEKKAFSGAKKLKKVYVRTAKKFTFKKGAFKGLKTGKMTVYVNKKMSKKNYKKLVKSLRKAGFKGKIKRYTVKKTAD